MCYDDRIIIESKGKIYKLEVGEYYPPPLADRTP